MLPFHRAEDEMSNITVEIGADHIVKASSTKASLRDAHLKLSYGI